METAKDGLGKDGLKWYALHVRARHEFVAHSELQKKQIGAYLPTIKKLRQWKDRKKLVAFPLFTGYLFVSINPEPLDYLKVLKTKGAVRFISSVPGSPEPIPYDEISSLKLLAESGKNIDVYPYIKEGTRVKVARGLFEGAEGILDKKEAHCTFVVNITLLGRSVGVKVCADDVECA